MEANADIHARTTAREIINDFEGEKLDYWVTGFGTGGKGGLAGRSALGLWSASLLVGSLLGAAGDPLRDDRRDRRGSLATEPAYYAGFLAQSDHCHCRFDHLYIYLARYPWHLTLRRSGRRRKNPRWLSYSTSTSSARATPKKRIGPIPQRRRSQIGSG